MQSEKKNVGNRCSEVLFSSFQCCELNPNQPHLKCKYGSIINYVCLQMFMDIIVRFVNTLLYKMTWR